MRGETRRFFFLEHFQKKSLHGEHTHFLVGGGRRTSTHDYSMRSAGNSAESHLPSREQAPLDDTYNIEE